VISDRASNLRPTHSNCEYSTPRDADRSDLLLDACSQALMEHSRASITSMACRQAENEEQQAPAAGKKETQDEEERGLEQERLEQVRFRAIRRGPVVEHDYRVARSWNWPVIRIQEHRLRRVDSPVRLGERERYPLRAFVHLLRAADDARRLRGVDRKHGRPRQPNGPNEHGWDADKQVWGDGHNTTGLLSAAINRCPLSHMPTLSSTRTCRRGFREDAQRPHRPDQDALHMWA
jgi:hypothetical protein